MTHRIVKTIGPSDKDDDIPTDNPYITTEIYHGGDGVIDIDNSTHSLRDAQRQDGRPGKVSEDAPYAPKWMEEQIERHVRLLADPLYRFVRTVAGLTNVPADQYWQGPVPTATARDMMPGQVVKPEQGTEPDPYTQGPWQTLVRLLKDRDAGVTPTDMRAWERLFGNKTTIIPQTRAWMEAPEQLGMLFLTPTIEAGIQVARDDIWFLISKPNLKLYK